MCGLAGLICWDERFRITPEMLNAMSARIAHRGPDASGIWMSPEHAGLAPQAQVGLVHRRLSILDPDSRADQPFVDGQGRVIVFNGEIYNFRELRAEIARLRPEYAWRTSGDTEVLLAAYGAWGAECVARLNGMYAFAIWDPQENRLLLARDRMGQKPLYYAHDPRGFFVFGSELPAVRAVEWVGDEIEVAGLVDYLTWGYTPRGTIYRAVKKVGAGEWMSVRAGAVERRVYFDPNAEEGSPIEEESGTGMSPTDRSVCPTPSPSPCPLPGVPGRGEERLKLELRNPRFRTRELVLQAVRRQLVSDVPLGCFLSGGIDSSIVAAAMRASVPRGQPVLTFSIGFDDPRYDETAYAAAVAKHIGSEHRQFIVRPNAAEDLPKIAAVFGEPFADSSALPTHYLSRETRRHVKVALSGDGGDELFGGYDRYRAMGLSAPMRMAISLLAPLRLVPGSHPKSRLARLKRLLATLYLPDERRYASYLRLFDAGTIARLLAGKIDVGEMIDQSERILTDRYRELRVGRDAVQAAAAVDRVLYLPEDLLAKVDRCSMLHALEVRSPLMDHELVRFAAGLSTRQLLGGGSKRMLREAFAGDLPEQVFGRAKMGFAVPIGEWLRTSLRPMLRDLLDARDSFAAEYFDRATVERLIDEHQTARADHSQRLYALLMLELWKRNFPPRQNDGV